ncbi:sulfite exporter TauE/SafE family protein [Candidatus Gottesmanbacteria bacterium]|nr:sulfite exporter TauE/SafE family protein [Candidatus Gottesmanbacteria bacterium]
MNALWFAFVTGLTTGGISCLAVQGGLLASSVATQQEQKLSGMHVGMFLIAKLIAYTLLGFVLGLLGSFFVISLKFQAGFQIFVGLFMLATAARIADIHPVFRYFVIQPPKWVYRLLKGQARGQSLFAPAILGFLTVLMPCGVTQAMMVVAVASGNPWMGAAVMFAFTLGTSPVFLALGVAAVELLKRKVFAYVAAGVIVYFSVLAINGGVALTGSPYTLQNFYRAATSDMTAYAKGGQVAGIASGVQRATISVSDRVYSSMVRKLKVGVPVELSLTTNQVNGCTRSFVIPSLSIAKVLPETGIEVVAFTPMKTGTLAYTCGMGMYTGTFEVIP